MSAAARIIVAGLVALALTISHAAYRVWPSWHGVEIYLPASLYPVGLAGSEYVGIDLAAERLRLDTASAVDEPRPESFQIVRAVGAAWGSRGESAATMRRIRGRDVFVQFEQDQPLWPEGPASMRPVTVSDTLQAGATNLAGHVTSVDEHGRLRLTFGSRQMPVPREVAARAKPRDVVREPNRVPEIRQRAADPGTFAIFRILPSGRATLAGLIVDGRRIE